MPREASLYEAVHGSIIDAFFVLRSEGKNIPPSWIERAKQSRRKRQKELGKLLKAKNLDAVQNLKDWELSFSKECFYYGLRVLLELERHGKTNL